MMRDEVILKKADLDFWKVGVRMINIQHLWDSNGFPLACAQKTHAKLGEEILPRNSSHENMEIACASIEAGS